jgi:2-polyprenyl-3-methyl-5-hydroxy-6-metoxy-1,4-benzoquinol methylase
MKDTAIQTNALIKAIGAINPLQVAFLDTSLRDMEEDERTALESYLDFCHGNGFDIGYLAKCYDVIVKDTLREQIFFQRHKRYRHSSYAEVADSVYMNDEYMGMYMHGLAITSYLWPNHREMRRFFMQRIPTQARGRYLEIGPGHGIYLMSAMQHAPYEYFEGVDISPTSIELTRNVLNSGYFGQFGDYELFCKDFLQHEMTYPDYDAIVMGEVLEHVEQPLEFLKKIRSLSRRDSFIYITTCINAPAIDHIYLFESLESLEAIIQSADLGVKDRLVVPYEGMSIEESIEKRMPVNVAYVLEV